MRGLRLGLSLTSGMAPALALDFLSGSLDARVTFTRGSTGTYFNSAGVLSSAAINTPRFDYDPVTLAAKGLLIEEARTNLLTYSSDWTNAAWSKTNVTVTAAATTSPDGTVNAQKLEATASAATSVITPTTTVAATSATFSVYVKQGTGATTANTFTLRNVTSATDLIRGTLNYSTGVFTYATGSSGVTVTNVGSGWWRVVMTATSGITSGDTIRAYSGYDGAAETAGNFLYAYGAQLEAGAFATSYIPTVASTVTRSADVATMTGTNFSSWYNQSAGTLVAEWMYAGANSAASPNTRTTANISDGTSSNRLQIYNISGNVGAFVGTGGVTQAALNAGTASPADTVVKGALAYATNDIAFVRNGGSVLTDTSATIPTVNSLTIGSEPASARVNGWVRSLAYFNTRLPDAQLQSLTA